MGDLRPGRLDLGVLDRQGKGKEQKHMEAIKLAVTAAMPRSPMSKSVDCGQNERPRTTGSAPKCQPQCTRCGGLGVYYRDVAASHPDFGKAITCGCATHRLGAKRRERLMKLDGLTEEEREYRLSDYEITPQNRDAYNAVTKASAQQRGFILVEGPYGVGKSRLLIGVVNECREDGALAIYASMSEILDYLRDAFNPKRDEAGYEERWELLVNAPVLVIDELEKFATTPWAMEKFTQLLHSRYRNIARQLTLMATNATLNDLPGDVKSRLGDGRAMVCKVAGVDQRPMNEWEATR